MEVSQRGFGLVLCYMEGGVNLANYQWKFLSEQETNSQPGLIIQGSISLWT